MYLCGVDVLFCCRTMNAMLNSSTGGTIYIGVSDDAKVLGLLLNQYKVSSFHWHIKSYIRPIRWGEGVEDIKSIFALFLFDYYVLLFLYCEQIPAMAHGSFVFSHPCIKALV